MKALKSSAAAKGAAALVCACELLNITMIMYLHFMFTSTARASPRLVSPPHKLRLLVMLKAAC
eukprot:5544161-Amphidinium_carterae.1